MVQLFNILVVGVSFLIGLSIGFVFFIIGFVKNIEDLIILGVLFLGFLLVLVVFVLIFIKIKEEGVRDWIFFEVVIDLKDMQYYYVFKICDVIVVFLQSFFNCQVI